jgi:hypothetical protein
MSPCNRDKSAASCRTRIGAPFISWENGQFVFHVVDFVNVVIAGAFGTYRE